MMKFLEYVANELIQIHAEHLYQVEIVVPTQRARIFLLRYLSEKSEKPVIAPEIVTMDQWMSRVAALTAAPPIRLLGELYQVGKVLVSDRCQSLHEFLSWGPQLLSDFDSIDEQLVNPESILTNTARAKAIEYWNPDREKGEIERIFETFYNALPQVYRVFQSKLQNARLATRGVVYRTAAEKITSFTCQAVKIYFIGFNALTKSEEKVIETLVRQKKAELIGDFDTYYTQDTSDHEAGRFYHKLKKEGLLSEKSILSNQLLNEPKKIIHHRISGKIHQVAVVSQIINILKQQGIEDYREVAIVVPDENMLFPLLHHLPQTEAGINVTMGIALGKTPVFQWLMKFLRASDFASTNGGKYYFRHVKSILSDGVAQLFFEGNTLFSFIKEIDKKNLIFLPADTLNSNLTGNESAVFYSHLKPTDVIDAAHRIIELALGNSSRMHIFEAEQVFLIKEYLQDFAELFHTFPTDSLKTKEMLYLMEEAAAQYSIHLKGEPLEGIQMMGMLETRLLDFRYVIILSANDDVLPGDPGYHSLIPYDIAIANELPEYRYQQHVKAYHFYRLLQRAEEIHMLSYHPATGSEEGTPSRFVYQIQWELAQKNKELTFTEEHHTHTIAPTPHPGIFVIEKDEALLSDLTKKLIEKGISPSQIANYLERPESFYTSYLLDLREVEEVEEEADARITGNIVHEVLELLYKPYINNLLNQDILNKIEKEAEKKLEEHLTSVYDTIDWKSGKNRINKMIILQMIKNQIRWDYECIKEKKDIVILYLEEAFECMIEVPTLSQQIKLHGKIDRIQKEGNVVHIIDYKTGSIPQFLNNLKLNDLENDAKRNKSGKQVQLLSYLLMGSKSNSLSHIGEFRASLNFLKRNNDISIPLKDDKQEQFDKESIILFEGIISNILKEILSIEEEYKYLVSMD